MSARAAGAAALAAALLAVPAAAGAQVAQSDSLGVRSIGLTVTVHAGGTAFTRFQNVTLEAPASEQGTYPARLAASTAASLGADMTVWFRPWLGARLDFVYAPSNFEIRLSEEDRVEVMGEEADYRGLDYSDLSLFSLSAAGVLALPIRSRHIAPYAVLGLGATLLTADDRGSFGLEQAFDGPSSSAFDVSGLAGIGVKIPLRGGNAGRVSLSFELMDRITRTPVAADDDRMLLDTEEIRVVSTLHEEDQESDARFVHGIGIAAGLTFATGGMTPVETAQ